MHILRSSSLLIAILCCSICVRAQIFFNGNLEQADNKGQANGWDYTFEGLSKFPVSLDSTVKRSGKYALRISNDGSGDAGESGAFSFTINKTFDGTELKLTVWVKTDSVEGYAGPWLRVDGVEQKAIAFKLLEGQISGTTDWKQYQVQIPYDKTQATIIKLGGSLTGKGKAWMDDFQLYIDEAPIEAAIFLPPPNYPALRDSTYLPHSGIDTILYTKKTDQYLPLLAQVWGFVKYYHPAVASGKVNWDGELFKILPAVLSCQEDTQFSSVIESWIGRLGVVRPIANPSNTIADTAIACQPDYGSIFTKNVFSVSLLRRLANIRDNRPVGTHHHVSLAPGAENPLFQYESSYLQMTYPDAGYRLLGVCRYYSIIQYFSPNLKRITGGWTALLPLFIRSVVLSANQKAYANTMARMIAATRDTHSFIEGKIYEATLGSYRVPFKAKYIEDKLVVTGYYKDTLSVSQNLHPGDVISAINGIPVDTLYARYRPFIPASNEAVVKRDIIGQYLLRSGSTVFHLDILRAGKLIAINQQAVSEGAIDFYSGDWNPKPNEPGYKLLDPHTGYIYCKFFKPGGVPAMQEAFKTTRGIIIDMRNYPTDDMIGGLEGYLLAKPTPFVKFTVASIERPGQFYYKSELFKGKINKNAYGGKIVVIVNERTQSNAEYVTMFLQSIPGTKVIGSQTAGADGNISHIPLLGGLSTEVTGLGVYYPHGTDTQGTGVKIDEIVEPTIAGIISGTDELLERAKRLIVE